MSDIYKGFYKSTDDKLIAGVCGGLAHKMNLNTSGLRFVCFLLAFFWIGLVVYGGLWMVLKSTPTKNIRPIS